MNNTPVVLALMPVVNDLAPPDLDQQQSIAACR